jgi:hypothetical protein
MSRARDTSSSACSIVTARGFSTMTWLPARSAASGLLVGEKGRCGDVDELHVGHREQRMPMPSQPTVLAQPTGATARGTGGRRHLRWQASR